MMANFTLGKRGATLKTEAWVWPPMPITSSFLPASVTSTCSMSPNFTFSMNLTATLAPSFFSAAFMPS